MKRYLHTDMVFTRCKQHSYASETVYLRDVNNILSCKYLRGLLLLLVMMAWMGQAVAQQMTDFEGVWYIASNGNSTNPTNYAYNVESSGTNYYLRPAADPQQSNNKDAFFDGTPQQKPFLTTNQTGHTDIALWALEKTATSYTTSSGDTEYYYTIRHVETGKYVVCDPFFSGTLGDNNNSRRKAMHLETKDWTTTIPDKALFKVRYTLDESTNKEKDTFDSYCFIPKLVENKEMKYWNISDKNQPVNYGTGSSNYGGLVGLYKFGNNPDNVVDINSRFKFEPYVVAQPTITFNNATNEVTITSSVTGAKIYYTTNDDTPTSELTPHTAPVTFTQTTPCAIRAIAVKSWSSGVEVSSEEAPYDLQKVATPTFSFNTSTNVVTITSTTDASIYYSFGTENTPAVGVNPYTSPFEFPYAQSNQPLKAIAVKEGWITSDIGEQTIMLRCPIPAISFNSNTQQATLSCADAEATMYYTTNGDTPNPGQSGTTQYAGTPLSVTSNTMVKAIATHAGYLASETATQTIVTEPTFQYIPDFSYVYDGTEKEPIDHLEYSSTTIPSTAYLLTYTNNTNVGTATVTITDSGADDGFIVYGSTTFTITQKAITITADSDTKGYDGTPLTNDGYTCSPGLATGDSFASVTVTGSQTNIGSSNNVPSDAVIKNGSNEVMTGNYAITYANGTLTVTEKSIGDGTNPAPGFTVSIGEGNTIILKDGETTLEQGIPNDDEKDFIISSETTSTKYSTRTITGKGNYSGSFTVRNAIVSFQTDANEREWSATFAAEGADPSNPDSNEGHELPSGITAYIITDIDRDWVIPEALNYIPEGVPVLLLSKEACEGFFVQDASGHTAITPAQISSNMLEETASTTHFNVRTIYLLHNNEFVYNIDGDLAAGKVYLNPNHSGGGGGGSGARLQIMWDTDTGIEDYSISIMHHAPLNDVWYTLDGCRLSGKPTKKGLYLCNGQKAVVR